jgi:hypothetical protein
MAAKDRTHATDAEQIVDAIAVGDRATHKILEILVEARERGDHPAGSIAGVLDPRGTLDRIGTAFGAIDRV